MPELPEVETVKRTLKQYLVGRKIIDIKINYDKIIKYDNKRFIDNLVNQTFNDIDRYGKYLIFKFNDYSLISHLRMEGKYFLQNDLKHLTKHDHIIFSLDNNQYLTYHDVRKFGTMELTKKGQEFRLDSLKKLGPEINNPNIDLSKVYNSIKHSNRSIKAILLDQTVITGLGNIYVDETLFKAKIHPETNMNELSFERFKSIIFSAQKVVEKAIKLGGTTIRSYQSSMGVDGRFQNELNVHTLVGKECSVCNSIIKKIRVAGRGTYFCPNCQKKESL